MRRSQIILLAPLGLMQLAFVASLITADRLPHLTLLLWTALIGLVAGAALARSSFFGWVAHAMSAVYGTFTIAVLTGSLPEIAAQGEWRERLFALAQRVAEWIRAAALNDASQDALVLLVFLCALSWLLSYSAAWFALRERLAWHAVLPTGAVLLANAYTDDSGRSHAFFLVLFFIAALAVLALAYLAEKEEEWLLEKVPFTGALRGWSVALSLALGFAASLVGWQASNASAQPLLSPETLRELQKPYEELLARWNRLIAGANSRTEQRLDTYPDTLPLEGPRTLTPELVMEVNAPAGRYYWRAHSYDRYDGRTWQNTADLQIALPTDSGPLPSPLYQQRQEVSASFVLYRGSDTIFSPNLPLGASLNAKANVDIADGGLLEIIRLSLDVPLLTGNRYTARGTQSIATAGQLRSASPNYPSWVRDQYLQVPSSVPMRVRNLAREIVGDAATPYDKAVRIERWLRDNIAYDENLPAPPEGMEASDYVLFEVRRAYCNYYATAMVMLLRSLGVPARVVVGYANGEPSGASSDFENVWYAVRDRDSHMWVEVFFPEYGWVEFEPTPAQLPIDREDPAEPVAEPTATPPTPTPQPAESATPTPEPAFAATPTPDPSLAQAAPPDTGRTDAEIAAPAWVAPLMIRTLAGIVLVLLGIAALAGSVVGVGLFLESFGLWRMSAIERAYALLVRYTQWMGIARGGTLTPYEHAELLTKHLPHIRAPVATITHLYVRHRFAPQGGITDADQVQAAQALRDARPHLRRALLRMWFAPQRAAEVTRPIQGLQET